jgi:hypothetical protein
MVVKLHKPPTFYFLIFKMKTFVLHDSIKLTYKKLLGLVEGLSLYSINNAY